MKSLTAIYPAALFSTFTLGMSLWLEGIIYILVVILGIFGVLDMRARLRDYKKLNKRIGEESTIIMLERIAKRYRYSWCQRQVAIVAFRNHGYSASNLYHYLGYRWYHILPDNTFSLSSPYLKGAFYKALLFGTK